MWAETRPDAERAALRVLLVGPYPPPHGGISVHVAALHRLLLRPGICCRVLDVGGHRTVDGPQAGRSPGRRPVARVGGRPRRRRAQVALRLLARIRLHARSGWVLHLHTNGHNPKSWLSVFACGLAALPAPGLVLTLHSGLAPGYLAAGAPGGRALARLALRPFHRVLCVNREIRDAVASLGVSSSRLAVAPACLPVPPPEAALPAAIAAWLESRSPVLSTALFFRPEYGFELLLEALDSLLSRHPALGCLVLGGGEEQGAVRERLAERGLDGSVLLAGDVPHALCLALMSRSDVFVRPSLADGDALSVREALALGVPVVASDAGARPPGTVVFRRGSASELVEKVESALALPAAEGPPPADPVAAGSLDRLLAIYREVAREERACAPSWEG